jgi:hypothetical protein
MVAFSWLPLSISMVALLSLSMFLVVWVQHQYREFNIHIQQVLELARSDASDTYVKPEVAVHTLELIELRREARELEQMIKQSIQKPLAYTNTDTFGCKLESSIETIEKKHKQLEAKILDFAQKYAQQATLINDMKNIDKRVISQYDYFRQATVCSQYCPQQPRRKYRHEARWVQTDSGEDQCICHVSGHSDPNKISPEAEPVEIKNQSTGQMTVQCISKADPVYRALIEKMKSEMQRYQQNKINLQLQNVD